MSCSLVFDQQDYIDFPITLAVFYSQTCQGSGIYMGIDFAFLTEMVLIVFILPSPLISAERLAVRTPRCPKGISDLLDHITFG